MTTPSLAPSERTNVKRLPERAAYDREVIDAILDEGYLCHVGIVADGVPIVTPTLFVRMGDDLILHGSPASRMLRTSKTQEICVTVTLVDGFVLARSALHHSMNYRSVVIIGQPEVVAEDGKAAVLDALVEHLTPGRIPYLRQMTDKEVKATSVLRLSLSEASAKVRTGPPGDDEEDYELPIWAGVIPVSTVYGPPETDPAMRMEVAPPDHAINFQPGSASKA